MRSGTTTTMSWAGASTTASEGGRASRPVRLCLAYAPGEQDAQLRKALAECQLPPSAHVSSRVRGQQTEPAPDGSAGARRVHLLVRPRRNIVLLAANALQALVVVLRERPQVVVACAADVAVAFVVLAKLICGAHVVFIESGSALGPTLSGRLCYPFSDYFVVHWPEQAEHYPGAVGGRGAPL